jgi:dienelactone hydrolase
LCVHSIGIFYKASDRNKRTPTILIGNGYDGSQEELYHSACIEVLKRGINCVTYEGPGQPTVRREQKIGFIPDWWTVASPVVDYLETRPDVDMTRLALAGISFGGQLVPLAASHDKRYSAL